MREYLAVATRPVSANGLGLPVGAALENPVELRRVARLGSPPTSSSAFFTRGARGRGEACGCGQMPQSTTSTS